MAMGRWVLLCVLLGITVPARGAESLRVHALRSASFFFEQEGRPGGIEYDILESFARNEGLKLSIQWAESFPHLLAKVERGEGDLAAGTITITPEREKRMDFSAPYFPVQIVLVERASDPTRALSDLDGSKVGAFRGTTAEDALKAIGGVRVVYGGTLPEMLEAVARGELRAVAADSSSVIPALGAHASLKIGLVFGVEQDFGFAFPKGSPWKGPLSQHILRLKESGIYFRIVKQHLGAKATEIVRAAKAR
jgi:polar amino acid transport system substrate-binding protein